MNSARRRLHHGFAGRRQVVCYVTTATEKTRQAPSSFLRITAPAESGTFWIRLLRIRPSAGVAPRYQHKRASVSGRKLAPRDHSRLELIIRSNTHDHQSAEIAAALNANEGFPFTRRDSFYLDEIVSKPAIVSLGIVKSQF